MIYCTGAAAAVPTRNKQKYIEHINAAWPFFAEMRCNAHGRELGVDVQRGKVNDLYGAVSASDDETVVFSWIEWPDRTVAAAAWQEMQNDQAMTAMPKMPFDGSRMIFGGFEPVFREGSDRGVGYVQGFALAVPTKNKPAYVELATQAWEGAFKPNGCLGMVEA